MPGEQTRTLWCLVDGDYSPFDVTVYDNHNINRLKESIKEKKNQLLFKEDASSLELWKVRIFYIPA
jgi:Crinkler effector protein N-terminal domain